jgi:FkbH-like protein
VVVAVSLYEDLSWLRRAPDDFRSQLKSLSDVAHPGEAIQLLAGHALSGDQLIILAKVVERLRGEGRSFAPLTPYRIGLVGNGTLDYIAAALVGTATRHGLLLECFRGEYDQVLQEACSEKSSINSANVDAVLLALDYRGLPLQSAIGIKEEAQASADRTLDYIKSLTQGIRDHGRATLIVQTLAPPPEALFGGLDRLVPGTLFDIIVRVNRGLAETYDGSTGLLFDVARIAETVGLARWHDPSLWNLAKLQFSPDCLSLYAEHVCRILTAARGKSRKCLVLDLDNTLWGGVIGDDGIGGILLAQGDATGEAHLSMQKYALALRERGIVLAVSSKNEDETARRVFREHPEMLLKEHHFAVFQANWQDKASNIQAIAAELSLGLDSLVFLDDNPAERELVRRSLPQVAVPELPENPALFARTLAAAGYFDTIEFTLEDRHRAEFYQMNARRALLQSKAADLDAYLASLDMEISFRPFDATSRARITQLVNKSNQFNLTTRRYTETEIAELENNTSAFTLQVRLTDTFGDNGMISVIICHADPLPVWMIDTWLMSCRVLGRKVEYMVLRELQIHARSRGIKKLFGCYIPTDRNMMVRDHYAKLGFRQRATLPTGETHWEMLVNGDPGPEVMRVRRLGFSVEVPA